MSVQTFFKLVQLIGIPMFIFLFLLVLMWIMDGDK